MRDNPFPGLNLVGGRISLDFANTVGARRAADRRDRLVGYGELVSWGSYAGVISEREAEELGVLAAGDPAGAERVWRRAVELREAIYRIVSATSGGSAPGGGDLDLLNRELERAMAHVRVVAAAEGFAWSWGGAEALDRVLWPVVRDVAELLVSPERARVGECAGDDCGWLFLDTSKNGRRRWCDMRDCGNRAKVRRHRQRGRGAGAP